MEKDPDYIISIGSSAGGLEEITTFFDHTPLDGVAYVVVQHLSPDFESRMVEIVSKHSSLVVQEATEAIKVCVNVVYLIPAGKIMTIKNGRLYLAERDIVRGAHLTINTFFKSLAADQGTKSIGIIFSGLGSDGSEGIKAIKEAGGMTMAQSPETAEFSSMPDHAIATDSIDFILDPASMPQAINSYVKHNNEIIQGADFDEKSVTEIIEHIHKHLPFDFTDYKRSTILRRTKRRAASLEIFDLRDYFAYLKETPEELKSLAKDFLISVTAFFRDPEAFDLLQHTVFPELLTTISPDDEIKFWIAGCATGEEAYSVAILIKELLVGPYKNTVVKIFATDIDSAALAYAGKGTYPADRVAGISPERLEKYFSMAGNNYVVTPEIRKMLIFAQHDLVKNPPYCNMHFISCRNLLIYMTPVLQKKVYAMLLFGLKSKGYLFLGSSENPLTIMENLKVINKKWRLYQSTKDKRAVSFDTYLMPELTIMPTLSVVKEESLKNMDSLSDQISSTMSEQMNVLTVCVDQHNTVIKSFGDTSKYLIPQNFNTNLAELLPRALLVAYNALSKQASATNSAVSVKGITVRFNNRTLTVGLSITPILLKGGRQQGLLVIFSEENDVKQGSEPTAVFDEIEYNTQYTLALEAELREAKSTLNELYDKLDSSNENLQSFNEELISANEEMQSTNEEMQSVNEELHTINADYQLKNKELIKINQDLNNYFRSNVNGQLFIDNDLRLMKYSPGAIKHINLLDSDIGRPIHHISTNIKFETIVDDAKLVLDKGIVVTKEIETNNGKWYQVSIMPYVQLDNENNGAIITFNDINDLKIAQLELHRKNQSLIRINTDLDHFIHAASHDLISPLSHIEGTIALLNDLQIPDTTLSEFLTIINSSVKTFRNLIADISIIATVENDITSTEKIDLNDIIDNIEWSLKDRIKQSGAHIKRDLTISYLLYSKKNMRSILYNLIANAIKFGRQEPPRIVVSCFRDGEYCVLTVEDNGIGMSEEGLSKIFDIYGRLHQDIEGKGIGLYLAKKIVNAAGGNMIVESEVGKGTKFYIYMDVEVIAN